MGQSNIAGRGTVSEAVCCPWYAGAEFRAVSEPNKLFALKEPFGLSENRKNAINDKNKKSGSLVSAFVSEYYLKTGHPVIAVSASEGGTSSEQWRKRLVFDAAKRFKDAIEYLERNSYLVGKKIMLWCQGETDGDQNVASEEYQKNTFAIYKVMKQQGIEKCGLIQIGHFNYKGYPEGCGGIVAEELEKRYERIRRAQQELCYEKDDFLQVASFEPYLNEMKDEYHYFQRAYNEVGKKAADKVSDWVLSGVINESATYM